MASTSACGSVSLSWNVRNANQWVKGHTVMSLVGRLVKLCRLRKEKHLARIFDLWIVPPTCEHGRKRLSAEAEEAEEAEEAKEVCSNTAKPYFYLLLWVCKSKTNSWLSPFVLTRFYLHFNLDKLTYVHVRNKWINSHFNVALWVHIVRKTKKPCKPWE